MPVDKTELAQDLASPEYQDLVKAELAKKDFIIRDQASETTFLENYKKDVIEKEIPLKIKAVHDQYDQDVKELFGMERNQDEKSYEFLKRAAKAKLDGLSGEIETLKESIKKGDHSGALKKQLEEAETKYKQALKEKDEQLQKVQGDATNYAKTSALTQAYAPVKAMFKKDLPPMFAQTEKYILDNTLANAILKDGVLYVGKDGAIQKDANFVEIKVEDYLKAQFVDVIDEKRKAGGAGSGGGSGDPGKGSEDLDKVTAETFVMPETIKNKEQLMDFMLEQGFVRGTDQFTSIWNKFAKPLPLR